MKSPAREPEDIVGRCKDCDRPMGVHSRIGDLGIARHAGHGRCDRCAKRARTKAAGPAAVMLVLPPRPVWMLSAPCASADPDMWHDHLQVIAAKRICASCPYRAACLTYAVTNGIGEGTWGGLSGAQRKGMTEADLYGDDCDGQAA
jgi:WhiB family redox-sensing transcriptional regulator